MWATTKYRIMEEKYAFIWGVVFYKHIQSPTPGILCKEMADIMKVKGEEVA